MKNSFKVSYVTTLPKEGNAPRVTITGKGDDEFLVKFHEEVNNEFLLVSSGVCRSNQTIIANTKQWYTTWGITITDNCGNQVYSDYFNPRGKVVFIKIDAYALGDTIAWIPYVDTFQRKHNCTVICSTFHNSILSNEYPNILFVAPNTKIENVYAQYYVGASYDDNPYYSPINASEHPLQNVASNILGLDPIEIRPNLGEQIRYIPSRIEGEYVTLSEFGSAPNKHWKGDWQKVVNYFIELGYEVVVISKEKTNLSGVIDRTGEIPLIDRMIDLKHAKMHLGVSSGLSWLAWAVGTHVLMISDVTPSWHEFQSDITRLNANKLDTVNYLAEGQTTVAEVLKKLGELGVS